MNRTWTLTQDPDDEDRCILAFEVAGKPRASFVMGSMAADQLAMALVAFADGEALPDQGESGDF